MAIQVKTFIKDIVIFVLIFMVFTAFGVQVFHIPSGSMEPTLEVGDRVVVSKYKYGYSRYSLPFDPPFGNWRVFEDAPERGEIVVFTNPKQGNLDTIKRVIGLPGDRIEVKSGRPIINGVMVPRTKVGELSYTNYKGEAVTVIEFEETLPNGVTYRVYEDKGYKQLRDKSLAVVPAGHFFMMGDNRDHSIDSRGDLGSIPMSIIVGRAEAISFSLYDCDQGKAITCTMGLPFGRFFTGL